MRHQQQTNDAVQTCIQHHDLVGIQNCVQTMRNDLKKHSQSCRSISDEQAIRRACSLGKQCGWSPGSVCLCVCRSMLWPRPAQARASCAAVLVRDRATAAHPPDTATQVSNNTVWPISTSARTEKLLPPSTTCESSPFSSAATLRSMCASPVCMTLRACQNITSTLNPYEVWPRLLRHCAR